MSITFSLTSLPALLAGLATCLCLWSGPVLAAESVPAPDAAAANLPDAAEAEKVDRGDKSVRTASVKRESPTSGTLSIVYPVLGVPAIDAKIQNFVTQIEKDFLNEAAKAAAEGAQDPEERSLLENWALDVEYYAARPSQDVSSISFTISSYTGGAHGAADIIVQNYDRRTGRQLEFADLFDDPEKALQLMSAWSVQELHAQIEESLDDEMLQEGCKPELQNFSRLLLTPEGLEIQFNPYQVGPWAMGMPVVKMPLSALEEAGPSKSVWH